MTVPGQPAPHGAAQLLRDILEIVNSEAHVVCLATDPVAMPGYVRGHVPTHVVLDCEGDIVGRGLDEDSAVADAITHYIIDATDSLELYRSSVRAWKKACSALEELS